MPSSIVDHFLYYPSYFRIQKSHRKRILSYCKMTARIVCFADIYNRVRCPNHTSSPFLFCSTEQKRSPDGNLTSHTSRASRPPKPHQTVTRPLDSPEAPPRYVARDLAGQAACCVRITSQIVSTHFRSRVPCQGSRRPFFSLTSLRSSQ